jgi:hypothetical protein
MNADDMFRKKPEKGFVVRTTGGPPKIPAEKRAALIRKGNELFNQGNFSVAKRIFLTTGYGDGLIRIGDYHYKRKEFPEAFRMYRLANEKMKSDELIEKMVFVIREWLDPAQG